MFFAAEEGDARGDRHNLRLVGTAVILIMLKLMGGSAPLLGTLRWHQLPSGIKAQHSATKRDRLSKKYNQAKRRKRKVMMCISHEAIFPGSLN